MEITGKRRLIFGLATVVTVAVVEVVVPGWSRTGAAAITLVAAFFYGERMLTSLKDLVTAVKGKFSDTPSN